MSTLPGKQYTPSCGGDGADFIERWCSHCARDRVMNGSVELGEESDEDFCDILSRSLADGAAEWRRLENGETRCLAFFQEEPQGPMPRCEHTVDMFEDARSQG